MYISPTMMSTMVLINWLMARADLALSVYF